MNYEIKKQILNKIEEYNRIVLFRHVRNDGDCVGATKGFKRIIELTWPEKEVYLIEADPAEFLRFMGPDDEQISDDIYRSALGIVLDTASEARISNKKYKICKELIKIDHHIPVESYGNLQWVEEERSSCCEMVVDFYRTFADTLKIDSLGATHLYTGMVTDSGRFKYEGVCGETMRCAAVLLDVGIDTATLYANLYLDTYESLKFTAHVYEHMQMTENGVAYILIDRETQERFGLTLEKASTCVNDMDGIRGCLAWIAFIETGDEKGTIRARIRSRFVHTNTVAEKYRGGGHACASGATIYGREELAQLVADTDAVVKEYKETHEGWL